MFTIEDILTIIKQSKDTNLLLAIYDAIHQDEHYAVYGEIEKRLFELGELQKSA